jgi:hypothetical protein
MHLLFVKEKVQYKKIKHIILLVALLVIPIVLLILPADYFNTGQTLCPSKRLLNQECPGCGMTRGVMQAIHFEFLEAWRFNKLTFLVLPIFIFYWIKWILASWKNIRINH